MAQLIDSVERNFGLKATAVVIAVVLWFTFNYFGASHDAYSKTLDVPLVVRGQSAGLIATTQVERVTVELTGARPDIDPETAGDLLSYVDATGKTPGVYTLSVSVAGRDADKISKVTPEEAIVVVDRYAVRSVPVVARDARGIALANATVVPSSIDVSGGATAVAQVVAAAVSVPEPRALPAGFAAEMKPDPVDAKFQHVAGVNALGVVRVTGPR